MRSNRPGRRGSIVAVAAQTETYDVIVVGLGGMGSATAWHLARRGVRVLGLEQFTPAHDLGSSHGDTRIVRMAYFENPTMSRCCAGPTSCGTSWVRSRAPELFVRTGALMIGAADADVVAGTLASAAALAAAARVLDRAEMAGRYPQFVLAPGEQAVFERNAGYVNPQAAVRAHLRLAERDGAELRFGRRCSAGIATVTGWSSTPPTQISAPTGW